MRRAPPPLSVTLPRWLEWLPQVKHEGSGGHVAEPYRGTEGEVAGARA